MINALIDFIKINKVSTSEVTDALGKTGNIPGVRPINGHIHCAGKVRWIYAYGESNWDFHSQICGVKPGEIIIVEAFDCNDRAVFGSIVSKFLVLYRQVAAVVVMGYVRDAHQLIKERYPLWAYGVTPIGCFNKKVDYSFDETLIKERREMYDGTIAICDDSGVAIIPRSNLNQDFLNQLIKMEEQEDIWFDCIDRRKWDTFETICQKKYLTVKKT